MQQRQNQSTHLTDILQRIYVTMTHSVQRSVQFMCLFVQNSEYHETQYNHVSLSHTHSYQCVSEYSSTSHSDKFHFRDDCNASMVPAIFRLILQKITTTEARFPFKRNRLRRVRKQKPQETQALALASSQSWLPLLRPSIPIGWHLRFLFTQRKRLRLNGNRASVIT